MPVNVQIPLFLKILTYDNNLGREDPGTVTVGIVYTEGDEESEDLKVALEENLREYSDKTLKGHPMRFLSLPFNSVSSLRESVRTHGIKVLYVAVSDISEIRSITDVSRSMDALTISGNPAHVSQGVSVVLGIKEKKPEIIVNLPSSRKEGTDFSAHLLRVCRVMQ